MNCARQTSLFPVSFSRSAAFSTAFFLSCFVFLNILTISEALAQPMAGAICFVVTMIYSDIGRGVATLGVMSVAVGAMFGKASWGMAITVAAGIGIIYSANWLTMPLLYGVGGGVC